MEESTNSSPQTHSRKKRSAVKFVPYILVVVAVGCLGFASGAAWQRAERSSSASGRQSLSAQGELFGQNSPVGNRMNGTRPIMGTVSAISSTSITVADMSSQTSTYSITSDTTVTNNSSSASVSDIKEGDTVAIIANTTNAKEAARIMLNPSFGRGFGGGQNNATGGQQTTLQ